MLSHVEANFSHDCIKLSISGIAVRVSYGDRDSNNPHFSKNSVDFYVLGG